MKRYDLVIPRGATVKKAWPIYSEGEPATLNGFFGRAQIRDMITEELIVDLPHILSYGNDAGILVDIENSYVVLYIPAVASEGWNWKSGIYDIELYNEDTPPMVLRVVQGRIRQSRDMTRDA